MTFSRNLRRLGYLGLGIALITLLAGMATILSQMHGRSEDDRYAQELVMWDLMSTGYLIANFQRSISLYLDAANDDTVEELQYRFDLVWTRFKIQGN